MNRKMLKIRPKKDEASFPQTDSCCGGRGDDTLRLGLSKVTVHWYLRHLEEGMTPKEVRKKTANRKITQKQNSIKRGPNQITPKKGPEYKKRKFPSATAG